VSGVSQTVRHLAGSDQIKGTSKLLFCVNHAKMGQNRSIIVTVILDKIECAPPEKLKGTSNLK
jgi:hypothetical protein